MKARHWSLAIVLLLINYIIFAVLFDVLIHSDFDQQRQAIRTAQPTFTPAPAEPVVVIDTPAPTPIVPTPTNTRVVPLGAEQPQNTPPPEQSPQAQLVAQGAVNVRAGPGTNHQVVGQLNPDVPMPVIGRNGDSSWWQIQLNQGDERGWVAGNVVQVSNAESVPVVP